MFRVLLVLWMVLFSLFVPSRAVAQGSCTLPAQILNLTNWKITIPNGPFRDATEITQPQLATHTDQHFKVNATCDGVVFRAPTDGSTTSGSTYPRSELREMTNNGTTEAAWSNTSGKHTLFIDQAITTVPQLKQHVVAGQIHDGNDVIVIRLEYPKLFIDIGGTAGPTLDPNYTLGKQFTVQFVAENGKIDIYYNGSTTSSYTLTRSISNAYFKAGAYTQSNCCTESGQARDCGATTGASCGPSNYGEVVIYKVLVDHAAGLTPAAPGPTATPNPALPTATPGAQPTSTPGSSAGGTLTSGLLVPSTWWVGLLFAAFLLYAM